MTSNQRRNIDMNTENMNKIAAGLRAPENQQALAASVAELIDAYERVGGCDDDEAADAAKVFARSARLLTETALDIASKGLSSPAEAA
jgi:hypothetical protein